jgi:hypothetical protein
MIDDLKRIAEEMGQPRGGTGEPTFIDYKDKAWAARLTAWIEKWGPFVGSAISTAKRIDDDDKWREMPVLCFDFKVNYRKAMERP